MSEVNQGRVAPYARPYSMEDAMLTANAAMYVRVRSLAGGRGLALDRMIVTWALCVLDDGPEPLSERNYRTRYCYEHYVDALHAYATWDGHGDPPGPWIKQKPEERLGPGAIGA